MSDGVASLDVVVPVFNEIECLPELVRRFRSVRSDLASAGVELRMLLVDDGSTDGSSSLLSKLARDEAWILAIHLVRNFGHQAAVTAGLDASSADYACVIDADLQDPPEVVPEMLRMLREENLHVIFGEREHRDGESFFKRKTAEGFYRFIRWASDLDIPFDAGDFRVMDRWVVDALRKLPEQHRLLRAMVPWLGFSSGGFLYRRDRRFAGTTKYPLRQMVTLATHAVFSFSTLPVRAVQWLALILLGIGAPMLLLLTVLTLGGIADPDGNLWLGLGLVVQTGLFLLAAGMLGGYLSRIQDEVKARPLYVRSDTALGDRNAPPATP